MGNLENVNFVILRPDANYHGNRQHQHDMALYEWHGSRMAMASGRLLCLLADSEVCPSFEGNMMEVQQFAWPISIWLNWISIGFANCKQGQFTHIHTHLWSIRAMLLSLMLMLMLMLLLMMMMMMMMMMLMMMMGTLLPLILGQPQKGSCPPKKKHINNQVSGAQNLCRPQIYWLAEGRVPILEMFTITMKPSSISNSVSA